ncbi:MAG: hypothetical protein M3Y52_00420 [Actinomycetota bacterium]|nr:hypothetical protein [Actinomycetota bacterium]
MTSSDELRGIPMPARTQPRGRPLRWRRAQLMAAGFDEFTAHRLASNAMVDVHATIVTQEWSRIRAMHSGAGGSASGE